MNETMVYTTQKLARAIALAAASLICSAPSGLAQAPTGRQTIDITSSFKPVLRESSKLAFVPTPPRPDTTPPRLQYSIPASNVIPPLSPFSISPVERAVDSAASWSNSNHIRAGYGNLNTPIIEAGLSFGDARRRITVNGGHISSQGKLPYQDYSRTHASASSAMPVGPNAEWTLKAGLSQDRYYQYGYDTSIFRNFSKDDLLRRYHTVSLSTGLRNMAPTEYGLRYYPTIKVDLFRDNRSNEEANIVVDLPIEKSIGDRFAIGLGLNANLTRLSPDKAPSAISNNLFTVPLTLSYQGEKVSLKGGIIPSWDTGQFVLLPTLRAELPIAGEKWILQAGWMAHYEKGSYQRLSSINPYIDVPSLLRNTRITERYAGFRGVLAKTFTYNARAGITTFRYTPLFVNGPLSGKSFQTLFEERIEALHIRGELGYVQGEQFSLRGSLNFYGFTKQVSQEKPWGMVPLELEGHLRWRILKDLWFQSDMFLWRGAQFRLKPGQPIRVPGAFDLNAGLEFRVADMVSLWARFQNITNARYQRWYQYDCYGFNMTGGVAIVF